MTVYIFTCCKFPCHVCSAYREWGGVCGGGVGGFGGGVGGGGGGGGAGDKAVLHAMKGKSTFSEWRDLLQDTAT